MDDADQVGRLLNCAARRELVRTLMSPVDRRNSGFSLVEILVAVLIVSLLAAILTPLFMYRLKTSRAEAIAAEMNNLQAGLQLFYRDVGRYPARLDFLNAFPTTGSVNDACGTAIPVTLSNKFRGPYITGSINMIDPLNVVVANRITKYLIATGDTVESTLTRGTIPGPVAANAQQVLQISIIGLEKDITTMVDSTVDGVVDANNGIVRYAAIQPTNNTILWTIPIKNGAC